MNSQPKRPTHSLAPSPRPLRKCPSLVGTNPKAVTEMPVTGRNQSGSPYGRTRISPKRCTGPIGKRCHRPSSAVGRPIGRRSLFRLLPGQPEECRSGRANRGAFCLDYTALGRFQAAARGGERALAAIGSRDGELRLVHGDEAARRRQLAASSRPIPRPGRHQSRLPLGHGSGGRRPSHLHDLTGCAGRGCGPRAHARAGGAGDGV